MLKLNNCHDHILVTTGLKRCPRVALGRPASPGPRWVSCFIHYAPLGCSSCPPLNEQLREGLASVFPASPSLSLLPEWVNTGETEDHLAWPFFFSGVASPPCLGLLSSSPSPSVHFEAPANGFPPRPPSWDYSFSVKTSPPLALRTPFSLGLLLSWFLPPLSHWLFFLSPCECSPGYHFFFSSFALSLSHLTHAQGQFQPLMFTTCCTGNLSLRPSTQTSRLLDITTWRFHLSKRTYFLFFPQNHSSFIFLHLGE